MHAAQRSTVTCVGLQTALVAALVEVLGQDCGTQQLQGVGQRSGHQLLPPQLPCLPLLPSLPRPLLLCSCCCCSGAGARRRLCSGGQAGELAGQGIQGSGRCLPGRGPGPGPGLSLPLAIVPIQRHSQQEAGAGLERGGRGGRLCTQLLDLDAAHQPGCLFACTHRPAPLPFTPGRQPGLQTQVGSWQARQQARHCAQLCCNTAQDRRRLRRRGLALRLAKRVLRGLRELLHCLVEGPQVVHEGLQPDRPHSAMLHAAFNRDH